MHLSSSPEEVFREPSLYQPARISHQLQTLQGVSVVSHKPLDLVASGRRMPGAAGNPPGGMHSGQGILGLSALTSSHHLPSPPSFLELKSQTFKELC